MVKIDNIYINFYEYAQNPLTTRVINDSKSYRQAIFPIKDEKQDIKNKLLSGNFYT